MVSELVIEPRVNHIICVSGFAGDGTVTNVVLKSGIAAAIVVGMALAALGALGITPVNKSHFLIQDPPDYAIPADYDALLLKGDLQNGNTFVIELTVRGTIQLNYAIGDDGSIHMPAYNIELLAKERSSDREAVTYLLTYIDGVERNYGITVQATANVLRFEFPANLLLPNQHIVGADAAVFSVGTQDYVTDGARETLEVQKAIALPINSYLILAAAAVCFAIAAILIALNVKTKTPPAQESRNAGNQASKLKEEGNQKQKV
jgi:multisubunit Na+/H+ antiporter MnhC subunit